MQLKWLGLGSICTGVLVWGLLASAKENKTREGWNTLSKTAARVIEQGGTEAPFSGRFVKHAQKGTYTCARCNAPLFPSTSKFKSGTGWPSFDQAIPGAVKEVSDADGQRIEIRCARCDGHLGHVFRGERFTQKKTRHCVNSAALGFADTKQQQAFFAGGCFWGVEHLLEKIPGVLKVESGYMGGTLNDPAYRQVVSGRSGHAETVRVTFDPERLDYETLAKAFFEIHDPTQSNRQGPDIGTQYRSAVFVSDSEQESVIAKLIGILRGKGFAVVTQVEPAGVFWPAEDYHQDYYQRSGKAPYCHEYTRRF
jgi:peptide methionine sulfoxide reductase msrA/msrB